MKNIKIMMLLLVAVVYSGCNEEITDTLIEKEGVTSTFVDERDGQMYQTVTIGNQTWMAENLKYRLPLGGYDGCITYNEKKIDTTKIVLNKTLFKDSLKVAENKGEVDFFSAMFFEQLFLDKRNKEGYRLSYNEFMEIVVDTASGQTNRDLFSDVVLVLNRINSNLQKLEIQKLSTEYTDYDYVKEHGYLYSFEAAKRAVPAGWKLPTDQDWLELEKTLGLKGAEAEKMDEWRGTTQGDALKNSLKVNFNAKLSGGQAYGYTSGYATSNFINKGVKAYYWTSTQTEPIDSLPVNIIRALHINRKKLYRGTSIQDSPKNNRRVYFSVRCVRE